MGRVRNVCIEIISQAGSASNLNTAFVNLEFVSLQTDTHAIKGLASLKMHIT
jgi:hypothetical protein